MRDNFLHNYEMSRTGYNLRIFLRKGFVFFLRKGIYFSPIADHFCWISNGMALLLVVGVPVALILMFNFVALSFTMVSIRKVQKVWFKV